MSDFFTSYGGDPQEQQPRSSSLQPSPHHATSEEVFDFLMNNPPTSQQPPGSDRPGYDRTVSSSFLFAQEHEDPMLMQQHMIAQAIALEQIQKQHQNVSAGAATTQNSVPPPNVAAHGIPLTLNQDRSMAPTTDAASHYSAPGTPGRIPARSSSTTKEEKEKEPQEKNKEDVLADEAELARAIAQAEHRLQHGQCPSCGQQLYKMVKVPRWKQFFTSCLNANGAEISPSSSEHGSQIADSKVMSKEQAPQQRGYSHSARGPRSHSLCELPEIQESTGKQPRRKSTGNNDTTETSGTELPESAPVSTGANPAGVLRKKPLHIPGLVHRGQCVKCSASLANDNAEEEEDAANVFLRDDEFEEDEYLQNSILSPLAAKEDVKKTLASTTPSPALANYEGPVNDRGQRHGQGMLKWSNGDIYRGNFVDGNRQGAGTLTFAHSKGEYVGDWINNEMHGQGTRRYPNGDLYTGPYVHGHREGRNGRFYFANGDLYVGEWYQDHMHGAGRYYYHHGQRFEGDFCKGKRHGKGKLQRQDGSLDIYRYEHNTRGKQGVRWSADRLTAWKITGERKRQIPIAQAVSLVYDIENAVESLGQNQHHTDIPTTQQGTTV